MRVMMNRKRRRARAKGLRLLSPGGISSSGQAGVPSRAAVKVKPVGEPSEVVERNSGHLRGCGAKQAPAEFLTPGEMCERLRISRATLDRQVKVGGIPRPIKIGHQVRFARAVVDRWLESTMTNCGLDSSVCSGKLLS